MNFILQRSQLFFDTYIKYFNIKGNKNKFGKCRMSFINYMIDVRLIN